MRDWLLLALTFAPVLLLGLVQRSGEELPEWIRIFGLAWFVVGSLIIGWYDGWLKRALVGILIFIPLMTSFVWWSGALPNGWPTALGILLIAGSVSILTVLGLATGWFGEVQQGFKRALGKASSQAKDLGPEA